MTEVSLNALIKRIRRRVARDGRKFHVTPERDRWRQELGDYYLTENRNVCGPFVYSLRISGASWACFPMMRFWWGDIPDRM
jgi:hypothetical protein